MCIVVAQELCTNKKNNNKKKWEVKETLVKLMMVCGWDPGPSAGKYFSISIYV